MVSMEGLGKLLILAGIVLVLSGVAVILLGRVGWPGKLPGDIVIRKEGLTIYFPDLPLAQPGADRGAEPAVEVAEMRGRGQG